MHIIVAEQDLKINFCMQILVPSHLLASAPSHFVCSGDDTDYLYVYRQFDYSSINSRKKSNLKRDLSANLPLDVAQDSSFKRSNSA